MSHTRIVVVVMMSFLGVGCATRLTEAGARVKLSKNEPTSNCKELGDVDASGTSMLDAKKGIRNQTAARGGNYVVLDTAGFEPYRGNTATGRAFKCP